MAIRIGINGFGRIGRLVYRIAAERISKRRIALHGYRRVYQPAPLP